MCVAEVRPYVRPPVSMYVNLMNKAQQRDTVCGINFKVFTGW